MPPHSAGQVVTSAFLNASASPPNLVLLLLNYTLPKCTLVAWKKAHLRICADGGANRLYDASPQWDPSQEPDAARRAFVPHIIKGDLDSIRPEVARFYSQLGTEVVDLSEDQDSTDLQKCVSCVERRMAANPACWTETTIFAVGAMGGRLDHTLSNINALYMYPQHRLVLCGDGSLVRLVPAGRTVIRPERSLEGPNCGVVALGAPAQVSSSGLKWDMDDHRLAVGGLMSTSNAIVADEVVLQSDQPLLWITELQDP